MRKLHAKFSFFFGLLNCLVPFVVIFLHAAALVVLFASFCNGVIGVIFLINFVGRNSFECQECANYAVYAECKKKVKA